MSIFLCLFGIEMHVVSATSYHMLTEIQDLFILTFLLVVSASKMSKALRLFHCALPLMSGI